MLFCSLNINPRRTHYPLFVAVFAAVSEYFFESKYSITIAAAVASIQPTGCQELSRPPHDLRSQDPESLPPIPSSPIAPSLLLSSPSSSSDSKAMLSSSSDTDCSAKDSSFPSPGAVAASAVDPRLSFVAHYPAPSSLMLLLSSLRSP